MESPLCVTLVRSLLQLLYLPLLGAWSTRGIPVVWPMMVHARALGQREPISVSVICVKRQRRSLVNLGDIRSRVRTIVDMDTVDLPNDLLDMYVRDGYDRMLSIERRWPFLQSSATLSTVANQREYLISSIGSGNFSDIISIFDGTTVGTRLTLVSHDDAEATWGGLPEETGRPLHYSIWESKLNLWPVPNGVYSLSLRGYRKPNDWTANTTTEVDADERLHQALVYYAVSQVYQLQEDVQLAAFYRSSFDENVKLVASDIMKPSSHRPVILSGQPFHDPNGFYQFPVYY